MGAFERKDISFSDTTIKWVAEIFVGVFVMPLIDRCLSRKGSCRLSLCVVLTIFINGCGSSGGGGVAPPVISAAPTSTLSGTIGIAAGTVVDSDVNDPFARYVSNDTYLVAQAIPSPVTLGGYLNLAGSGPVGGSSSFGDLSDYYRVRLEAGQTVTVTIANAFTGDLDLYLYNDNGTSLPTLEASSLASGAIKTLPISASGDYFIEVRLASGYSSYTLTVGNFAPQQMPGRLNSTDAFVAGDVIVKFRDDLSIPAAKRLPAARAAALGLQAKAGSSHQRSQLMNLGASQARPATFKTLGLVQNRDRQFRFDNVDKQLKFETMQVIKALRQRADVLYAEPNYIYQTNAVPTDPLYSSQWHYPLINLPAAWDLETGVSSVTVAVVDTGVLLNHPDLQGQFSADGGYDFISSDSSSGDGEPGIDANPDDPGDSIGVARSSFHGTHVAGTVAAATAFSAGGSGIAGVAPGVKIMPVRALGKNGGTSYDIIQSVRYAAGLSNDSGIILNATQRADVINLSLGRVGGSIQAEQDLYTEVRGAGVIVVASAGNENSSVFNYPAAYAGVISVAAVDISKQKAPYSSFGSTVDVAAPGGYTGTDIDGDGFGDGVLSTLGDDSGAAVSFIYGVYNGTSMAAPHMAGVVALMKSSNSTLTPAAVDALLQSGAIVEDLGAVGRDDIFGHGLINAHSAVVAAQSAPAPPPLLGISPTTLNMGAVGSSAMLAVSNVGSGTLQINSVTVTGAPGWLTVSEATVNATTKSGLYRVIVDRASVSEGSYQAEIVFASSVNSVTVSVSMQVIAQALNADAGYHYVLLIDTADFSVLDQWQGAAEGGSYRYQFDNVLFPADREYYVVGGTDLDNDSLLCDFGEACGIYFSPGDFRTIGRDDTHSGLDFITGFGVGVQASSLLQRAGTPMGFRRQPTIKQLE
ncbi:MAG: S8 family serine peptidase [Gammaproteobacteria bacterium]|nr:S8 family serine peptidase [Gammaproteobacteria bacterium]